MCDGTASAATGWSFAVDRWRRWLPIVLLTSAFGAFLFVASNAPSEPVLTITNTSDDPMEVYVGGDRVRIIAGHDTEFLELPPYAWAWKRRIEVRRWPNGEVMFRWRADLSDLADNHWRLRIP